MMPYVLSAGVGLAVGVLYASLGVRSPAPPVIALIGLLGMLLGEQLVPLAKRLLQGRPLTVAVLREECGDHVFGRLPGRASSEQGARDVR
jgi:XapX domain-containing protein